MALLTPANASWASAVVDRWQFDDTAKQTLSGSDIASQANEIGGGAAMAEATTRPAKVTTAFTGSKTAAQFTQANTDCLSAARTLTAPFTIMFVAEPTALWDGEQRVIESSGAAGRPVIKLSYDAPIIMQSDGKWDIFGGYTHIPGAGGSVVVCVYDGASSKLFLNGYKTTGGSAGAMSITSLRISGESGGYGVWSGNMGEALIVNRALTDAEADEFTGYGAWYWDGGSAGTIVGKLDAAFAYKSAAPTISSGVTGTLAQTLGAVTSASAGRVAVQGALAKTLGALTSAAAGTVSVKGALAQTLGGLAISAAGTATGAISGTLAVTLGAVTATSAGQVAVKGNLAGTLGGLTVTSAGAVAVKGAVAQTLGGLALASTGVVGSAISGALAQTLGAVTAASAGAVAVRGVLAATLGDLANTSAGAVAVKGALSQTLGGLQIFATGSALATNTGVASITLGGITLSAAGNGRGRYLAVTPVTRGALVVSDYPDQDGTLTVTAIPARRALIVSG